MVMESLKVSSSNATLRLVWMLPLLAKPDSGLGSEAEHFPRTTVRYWSDPACGGYHHHMDRWPRNLVRCVPRQATIEAEEKG